MLNFIKKTVLPFVTSTGIFFGGLYTYVYYQTYKNSQQYKKTLQAGTLIDASRLSNQSFGISWGFQADDIVMKQIDSGDYLFMKYDCQECLTPSSYISCFLDSLLRLQQQFDSVGYAYRNKQELYIVFNQFGKTRVLPYSQLVGLPFIKEMMVQKNDTKNDLTIHRKLKQIVQKKTGTIDDNTIEQTSIEMANRINKELFGDKKGFITDLKQLLESQKQIYVRTETNRTLRSL